MAYQGKFFVKKMNTGNISNSNTKALGGLIIPPYTQATRYWIHSYAVAASDCDFDEHMPYRMTGLYDIVPNNITQTESGSDVQMETYRRRFFPESANIGYNDEASWGDGTAHEIDESDVEMPGGAPVTSVSKSQRFFHHEKLLGMPRNALINGTGNIRYVDEFTRKGKFNNKGRPLEHTKMVMLVANSDSPDTTTDSGDYLWGNYQTTSSLSETITDIFQDGNYDFSSGMDNIDATHGNALENWYSMGFADGSSHFDQKQLSVITQMTIEVKAYTPHNHRTISAP